MLLTNIIGAIDGPSETAEGRNFNRRSQHQSIGNNHVTIDIGSDGEAGKTCETGFERDDMLL